MILSKVGCLAILYFFMQDSEEMMKLIICREEQLQAYFDVKNALTYCFDFCKTFGNDHFLIKLILII